MSVNSPRILVPRQVRGQPIKAKNLASQSDAINAEGRVFRGPRQIAVSSTEQNLVQAFVIKEVSLNYLVCRTWDGPTSGIGDDDVLIAKPRLLLGDNPSFGTAVYSGYTDDGLERTSVIVGETNETQVVVPTYQTDTDLTGTVYGSIIYAIRNPGGGSGVLGVFPDDPDAPLEWLDLNIDGRAWAKKDD